ncbi:MAG: D-alanine--D-alanine ligase family protein [Candidatus Gracilibacteria bacterium]
MQKLRIALLFGGKSAEHEISIKSAKAIYENLDKERYDVYPIPFTKENFCVLSLDEETQEMSFEKGYEVLENGFIDGSERGLPPAVLSYADIELIIPIIHGSFGEDGKLQGMLDMLEIPYLGAGVLGSAIGMDKEIQKILVKSQGIEIAPFKVFHHADWSKDQTAILSEIQDKLSLPYFVKPANAGSSVGISKVKSADMLEAAMNEAFLYDTKVIIEEGLSSVREIESAVIGNSEIEVAEAFSEVIPDREFYDYEAKYASDSKSQVIIPAAFTEKEHHTLKETAKKIYRILQCSGFARVDLFVDKEGVIYFNEINTLPGFTPISAFSKMWKASGVSYPQLLDKLIQLALDSAEEKQRLRYSKA